MRYKNKDKKNKAWNVSSSFVQKRMVVFGWDIKKMIEENDEPGEKKNDDDNETKKQRRGEEGEEK